MGGGGGAKNVCETYITTPIRTKARSSLISIGMSCSFFNESAILRKFRFRVRRATGPDRTRPGVADGTGPAVVVPSRCLLPRHTPERHRACNPSRSDNSGTPREAAGTGRVCTRAVHGSRSTAPLKETKDFAVKFRHRGIVRLAPGIDDNGPLRAQLVQMQANCLAQPPLDAIAHHGFSDRARDRKSDARPVAGGLTDTKSGEERPTVAGTLVVNSSEVLRSQQTDTFGKTKRWRTTSRH